MHPTHGYAFGMSGSDAERGWRSGESSQFPPGPDEPPEPGTYGPGAYGGYQQGPYGPGPYGSGQYPPPGYGPYGYGPPGRGPYRYGPPGYGGYPPPGWSSGTRRPGEAVAALVLAILSFVVLPLILSIVALILAGVARNRIYQSSGTLHGLGMVRAAQIVAIINVVFAVFGLAFGLAAHF